MATRAQGYMSGDVARAIGVVNGTRVGGTRKPRNATRGLTDVLVTYADGSTDMRTATSFRGTVQRTRKPNRHKVIEVRETLSQRDIALMRRMGTIHSEGA